MIPLAYVVRESRDVPASAADPSTAYATVQEEMINRAPHGSMIAGAWTPSPVYLNNRQKVFDIMAKIFRENAAWTYVKPSQRSRDGRKAYHDIFNHFLGPNNVDNLATAAESTLTKTTYEGEKRSAGISKST